MDFRTVEVGVQMLRRRIEQVLLRQCDVNLAPGEVHVWIVHATTWAGLAQAASSALTPAERARAESLQSLGRREEYTLAHAFWRTILRCYMGDGQGDVDILTTAYGKPTLPGTALATSLSRSGAFSAIAVGRCAALGVDIERAPARVDMEAISEIILARDEADALADLGVVGRARALLRVWTRKEALLKAWGCGLSYPMHAFSAPPGRALPCPLAAAVAIAAPSWSVHDLDLAPGLAGALALTGAPARIGLYALDDGAG